MILVEWEDNSGTQYRASTASFTSAPNCSIAPNKHYDARIISPGGIARYIWRSGQAQGATTDVSIGEVILANADGALDHLLLTPFDGRKVVILEGSDGLKRRDQFTVLLSGTLSGLIFSGNQVRLRVRDRVAQISNAIAMPIKYLGNNSLPDGVEGVPEDWKDRCKPWLVGNCENILPPRVNTSQHIYQVSAKAINDIVNVWSNGAAITAGTARANLAALIAATPGAGTYDWCLGDDATGEGAYFKLGTNPANATITCHAREGSSSAQRTAAQVFKRIILVAPGMSPSDISEEALRFLDSQQSGETGWWFPPGERQNIGGALDAILLSVGAAWTPDRRGIIAPARLTDPAGVEPEARYSDLQILPGIQVFAAGITNDGVPPYEINLLWGRNWNVQPPNQVAGSVLESRRNFLGLEYRTNTANNNAVWDVIAKSGDHPLSQPLTVTTQLRTLSDAQIETNRLLNLYSNIRIMVDLVLPRSVVLPNLDLGSVIEVTYPRFGLETGKKFTIIGMDEDWSNGTVRIEGWG